MHRQKYDVRKAAMSPASLPSRLNCLYCPKCRRAVKRRLAIHAGRNRSRCPACGEILKANVKGAAT